ncbi:DUF2829 domain-containing protein [Xenorhabdus bovienii]|uniref:Thoeris anti-defense Tad2 family protein n=1 Tax=Xenorhabdus bovienii TaxID=40576 RepID=UPI0023B2B077|nr:MW1434 family type I TA system toxin [Xenorhabdus bovienii]MDE9447952.1 DUF2829 domain-containing protein [Xenorhabdus bovienii]
MSDVNKPESQKVELKCPFNPDQYSLAAPIGSFPWALSQVFLGNKLHRSDWDSKIYIYLSDAAKNKPHYIAKSGKYGDLPWVPEQEDLMACDWNLLKTGPKPDNCMLSFDLTIGTGKYSDSDPEYGYLADDEFKSGPAHQGPFGTLTNLQNKTDITKFSLFIWDSIEQKILVRVSSDNGQAGFHKMEALFAKNFTVTVGSVAYPLGSAKDHPLNGKQQYEFVGLYGNDDAKKLGALLKQNVDKTLHFCFNWK